MYHSGLLLYLDFTAVVLLLSTESFILFIENNLKLGVNTIPFLELGNLIFTRYILNFGNFTLRKFHIVNSFGSLVITNCALSIISSIKSLLIRPIYNLGLSILSRAYTPFSIKPIRKMHNVEFIKLLSSVI